jgi:SAM-dependent methyltransferase
LTAGQLTRALKRHAAHAGSALIPGWLCRPQRAAATPGRSGRSTYDDAVTMDISMPPEAISMPDPGDDLISRVARGTDRASFYWSGRESVRELERTLAIVGQSLDSFESILDFGCGCGRMLLWMERVGRRAALFGTDIDNDAIAWCRDHIPYADVAINNADPPLPYAAGTFDLVYNHSVFTHIDELRQDAWLAELERVTRPGGFVVLSVHGELAIPDGAWHIRDQVEREGIAFVDRSMARDFPLPDWYQNTYHAPWYVFEHWARWFEIRAYIPRASLGLQDHVLLERRSASPRLPPLSARPQFAAPGVPASRVVDTLGSTRAYQAAAAGSSGARSIRQLARELVLRVMRPYTVHEDRFDDAVVKSIAELAHKVDHHAAMIEKLQDASREQRADDT